MTKPKPDETEARIAEIEASNHYAVHLGNSYDDIHYDIAWLINELRRTRNACKMLLDGVNARHPEKEPLKWTCPDMKRIAWLINYKKAVK